MPKDLTDEIAHLRRLMARVAAGDRAAFRDLYAASSAKLYGVAARILADRDAARDLVQEVYVKIWQSAARFDADKASPMTWMLAIARNLAIDTLRRRRMRTVDVDDDVYRETLGSFEDPLDGRDRAEGLTRLMGCLEMLDDKRRQAVLLAYYHGHTREDLSRRFAVPVPTVKTWLHRSLAQLRGCLGT